MSAIGPGPHFSPSSVQKAEGARPAAGAARLGTKFQAAQTRHSSGLDALPQLTGKPLAQRQVSFAPGQA
jgi:hypothetical protein